MCYEVSYSTLIFAFPKVSHAFPTHIQTLVSCHVWRLCSVAEGMLRFDCAQNITASHFTIQHDFNALTGSHLL